MPSTATLPTAIASIFESLQSELVWIHGRWILYRQLFGTNPQRVELLNESAGTFFHQLHQLWFDYIVLEICRMSDPTTTFGHDNLVIGQISKRLVRSQNLSLLDRLDDLQKEVDLSIQKLRDRRNKHIAHNDFQVAMDAENSPIPGVSRQMIEDALKALRDYLNAVSLHFTDSEMAYQAFSMMSDGNQLVYNLKRASEYADMESADWTLRQRVDTGKWKDA